jgi:hypothetical protein
LPVHHGQTGMPDLPASFLVECRVRYSECRGWVTQPKGEETSPLQIPSPLLIGKDQGEVRQSRRGRPLRLPKYRATAGGCPYKFANTRLKPCPTLRLARMLSSSLAFLADDNIHKELFSFFLFFFYPSSVISHPSFFILTSLKIEDKFV